MTGWAWVWMAATWAMAAAWVATIWALRPRLVICACGKYRMNGWVRVRDDDGWHERDRCQPPGEAI